MTNTTWPERLKKVDKKTLIIFFINILLLISPIDVSPKASALKK